MYNILPVHSSNMSGRDDVNPIAQLLAFKTFLDHIGPASKGYSHSVAGIILAQGPIWFLDTF